MILKEFFGHSINPHSSENKEEEKFSKDDLFWFLVDNDKIHKKYFFPIAHKIKNQKPKNRIIKDFLPMVNQGCLDFIKDKKLFGRPSKLFPLELREELCERLYDHYCDDIQKGKYKLG